MKKLFALLCVFFVSAFTSKVENFFQYSTENKEMMTQNMETANSSNYTVTYNNMTGLSYNKDMSCENCIRSGYDFCTFKTFPDNKTHEQFSNCSQNAINPKINTEITD